MENLRNIDPNQAAVATATAPERTSPTTIERPSVLYLVALIAAFSTWFANFRAPLWLDETVSWWEISAGVSRIWDRAYTIPAYSYILWSWKSVAGNHEMVLRIPSVVAMALAVFLLYRCARHFFTAEISYLVAIAFCLNGSIIFAAIDVRPYAFAVLAVVSSLWFLLRWSRTDALGDAVLFGLGSAAIIYFHQLFAVILPAFLVAWLLLRPPTWKPRNLVIALSTFVIALLPTIFKWKSLIGSGVTHVCSPAPEFHLLLETLVWPLSMVFTFGVVALLALFVGLFKVQTPEPRGTVTVCLVLGWLPVVILFTISRATPVHIFLARYCLVAVPGVALAWGLLINRIGFPRWVRLAVAFAVVLYGVGVNWDPRVPRTHESSWREAIQTANQATAADHAPVIVCSGIIESNYQRMEPAVLDSMAFAPLSYYKVESTVVPLPLNLTDEAKVDIDRFLHTVIPARQRFVAIGSPDSYRTLSYIDHRASKYYGARLLGVFQNVAVIEYDPVAAQASPEAAALDR